MTRSKRILALLALVLLLAVHACPAFATSTGSPLVIDDAWILYDSEVEALESTAQGLRDEYGIDVAIITVDSMGDETDAIEYAKTLYNLCGLGTGADRSGILLMLSMENRDYALIAHGEGNTVLTDYGREAMADSFLPYFAEDDWYGGFTDYLETAAAYCYAWYVEGDAFDVGDGYTVVNADGSVTVHLDSDSLVYVLFALSGLIGFLGVRSMIRSMKTARLQTHAEHYVDHAGGGFVLTEQSDDYVYSQTIVTHRPKSESSSGGTTVGSGGFSGSSGKF